MLSDLSDLSIRDALGPGEYPRLVWVWRSAVDATHQFLAEEHRDEIESRLASDYLPRVDLHVAERGVTTVDVNEQNERAVGFYHRHGFTFVSRSELDDQGRPYPLLHLALRGKDADPEVVEIVDYH